MIFQVADDLYSDDERARNQTTVAHDAIRTEILAGLLIPEQKLKVLEMAARFNVSPGAIREALSRLIPEKLVVLREKRGFIVAPLSISDLSDLTDARCEIESIALRRSVELGDRAWEADILAAEHRLGKRSVAVRYDDGVRREWMVNHAAFHHSLVSACGNDRLLSLCTELYDQSERYRGLLRQHREGTRDIDAEHREIVRLALARDVDGLIDAVVGHQRLTTELIVKQFGKEDAG